MKTLAILLLIPFFAFSQVGIKTTQPTATLDVNGNIRVRQIPTGVSTDSILVINNGHIRKIPLSAIIQSTGTTTPNACPIFVKNQSNGYYLLFKSAGSIPNPANNLTINNLNFTYSGDWIQGNMYFYSWSNTTGQPLNINNFSINFGNQTCNYNQ